MPGTDTVDLPTYLRVVVRGARYWHTASAYAPPTNCPVLTSRTTLRTSRTTLLPGDADQLAQASWTTKFTIKFRPGSGHVPAICLRASESAVLRHAAYHVLSWYIARYLPTRGAVPVSGTALRHTRVPASYAPQTTCLRARYSSSGTMVLRCAVPRVRQSSKSQRRARARCPRWRSRCACCRLWTR